MEAFSFRGKGFCVEVNQDRKGKILDSSSLTSKRNKVNTAKRFYHPWAFYKKN
jgi:hypothetical protein